MDKEEEEKVVGDDCDDENGDDGSWRSECEEIQGRRVRKHERSRMGYGLGT